MARFIEIDTPLGGDVLLFHRMKAEEEVSRLFRYQLELLSDQGDINLDKILGQNVTVKLELPKGTRPFNGFVSRFSQDGRHGRYHRYTADVRPWLWFLTRRADCRIFQEMTVPDILKQVFEAYDTADFSLELTQQYRTWTYCVQYRETDFNFVSRLMESEGIYYYFRHTDGHHTLVLTDSTSNHAPSPGYETLPFIAPDRQVRPDVEHVSAWRFGREMQPGAYVHDDYDLERPSVELRTQKVASRVGRPEQFEIYEYPGEYLQRFDGEHKAAVRIDEFGTQFEQATGETNARGLRVGSLFTLKGCPRDDQNVEYLVRSAVSDLEYGEYEAMPELERTGYTCRFVAMPSTQQFRPERTTRRPFVQGPQTAVVVGPSGDEIYTDKYGRVKVQFHWDRQGRLDENSSCWIRVSHPWAGNQWGAIFTPRIGQEVIVDFLEGDPDQPIVTGRVYNAEQMPPYALPDQMTQSGVKSRSTKQAGPANFNEIRFEDKKGAEQLFIHAEKNQDIEVENDETHWVGHDRTKTIDNDETTHVKHDRTETVDNNETITIGGDRSTAINKNETLTVTLQRTHSVGINETISVGGAQEITVGGLQAISVGAQQSTNVGGTQSTSVGGSRTVKVGGSQQTTIDQNASLLVSKDEQRKVDGSRQVNIGKDDTLVVKKNLLIDAGDALVIKTGSASISMKKDGTIVIKGKDITIEGSGRIDVKASKDVVIKGSKIKQN